MKTLDVRHETALPIREISALALRAGDDGKPELLAVGDEDFAVVAADLKADGSPKKTRRHDLFLPLVGTGVDLRAGSGFEGVAADGDGVVLVLQEEESRLLVFSADLSRLVQVLWLVVPEDTPGYGKAWNEETNRRGEGLLLLKRGHVLLGKQKEPVYLIEFGPAGDDPLGVAKKTILEPGKRFVRPDDDAARLVPLAAWELGDDTATINDLAFGDDGRTYLLSSEARTIVRLEARLEPDERARADESWKIDKAIPGGKDARPEGLVLLPGGIPVIGVDSKEAGGNLAILSTLDR